MKDCVAETKKLLKEKQKSLNLTDAQLDELVQDAKDAWKIAQAQVKIDPEKKYFQLLDQQARSRIENKLIQKKTALNTIMIQREMSDFNKRYLEAFPNRDSYDAMYAYIAGEPSSKFFGGADSVLQAQITATNSLLGILNGRLSENNVLTMIRSGLVDDAVTMDALYRMADGQSVEGLDPHAVTFAKTINELMERIVKEYGLSNVDIPKADAYAFRRHYSPYVYSAKGRDAIVGFLNETLDRQAMTEKASWLADDKKWNDMLEGHFEDTVNGREVSITGGEAEFIDGKLLKADPLKGSTVRGVSRNVQKQFQNGRFFIFKDGASEARALRELSDRNLLLAVTERVQQAGKELGLVRKLGINYANNFNTMRAVLANEARALAKTTKDTKLAKRYEQSAAALQAGSSKGFIRGALFNIDNVFENLTGQASRIDESGQTLAEVTRNISEITSMSKLGHSAIAGLGDLGNAVSELRFNGSESALGSFVDTMGSMAKSGDPAAERELKYVMSNLEGFSESIKSRYGLTDAYTHDGAITKLSDKFHKVVGASLVADSFRNGISRYLANNLGEMAEQALGKLPKDMQIRLKQHGINATEWDVMRKHAVLEGDTKRKFMFAKQLDDIETKVFQDELSSQRGGKAVTEVEGDRYRSKLQTKINNLVNEALYRAIPSPDAIDRSRLLQGTRAGTVGGSAMRLLTQFISFPLAQSRKNFSREFFGRQGATGFNDWGAWGRFAVAPTTLGLAVQLTVTGYLLNVVGNLLVGKAPPDPTHPDTWMEAFTKGGAGTIVGDQLMKAFGDDSNRGKEILSALAGPNASEAAWGINAIHNLVADHDKKSVANAGNFVVSMIPFQNTIYTDWAIKWFMLNGLNEWGSPGYISRMEKRAEESGQPYLIKPSSTNPWQ